MRGCWHSGGGIRQKAEGIMFGILPDATAYTILCMAFAETYNGKALGDKRIYSAPPSPGCDIGVDTFSLEFHPRLLSFARSPRALLPKKTIKFFALNLCR